MNLNSLIKQFRYYFDIRGIETDELPNAPTGWRELLIEYSRSKTYGALLRNITGQLDFASRTKGAYLLRREYAKYRLLARINLRINEDTRKPYNTYENIYTGQIDFSKKIDRQASFTVNAKSLDFSQNIDAYDSQQFQISLADGINLELPGIALAEIANLLPSGPPDGAIHSDYFPPVQVVNNTQNSIAPSVQSVPYVQLRNPDFSTQTNWVFDCQYTGKLQISNNIAFTVFNDFGVKHLRLKIVDQTGATIISIYDDSVGGETSLSYTFNSVISVTRGQKLFLYMQQVDAETINTGITITSGQIDFSYNTITPPTMCQAITGVQLFARLLQAMNINQDSSPNLPVTYQSFLLSGALAPLVFSCSDSIRAAQGSIFHAGDTIGPGIYKVIVGSVIYSGTTYTLNQQFAFVNTATMFTGTGVIQKIQSAFVGNVYNVGDGLQAGGTYQVEGLNAGIVTYNSTPYTIGQTFKFVLGVDTFTASNDSMFVKQIAIDPQIIISFADVFQTIKSVNGGDCAFGVNRYKALNDTPAELAKQLTGIPFIETLASVYKAGINQVSLGNLSKDWQSECALDMMYNTIDVGQKDQQYDALNGYNEVSSTQSYASALLTPVAKLNLVSPIRFDPYGAETIRITQNDTAASRSDNDTFGFWINTARVRGASFEYYRPLGSEGLLQPIVGVPDSYYNYKLSPKTNLQRGDRYLASIFYNMSGYQLQLTGYLKNVAMSYVGLDGVRVSESEPIEIATLGKPYFIPEYIVDTIPTPDISSNEYADLNFNINGNNWKAFVVAYKSNPAMGKPQQVKFLLTANNDMSRMVR